jgi:hypothetical protein
MGFQDDFPSRSRGLAKYDRRDPLALRDGDQAVGRAIRFDADDRRTELLRQRHVPLQRLAVVLVDLSGASRGVST